MEGLRIGRIANLCGVNVETIRFYERKGLLSSPQRSESGYREYAPEVVGRLRFIRQAKELGFSLTEIAELLALSIDPTIRCEDVRRRAQAKIADIEGKLRSLNRMKQTLRILVAECPGSAPVGDCPILGALNQDDI